VVKKKNRKKMNGREGGGGEGCKGFVVDYFFEFFISWATFVYPKMGRFVPINSESATSKRVLKTQPLSLIDHFDRCFPHTPGEGLVLGRGRVKVRVRVSVRVGIGLELRRGSGSGSG
jgi:hypothetical protein